MNRLILTVGLPRCGKTTWAKKQGIAVVNPDTIRLAIHGQRFNKDFEGLVWFNAKVMVKHHFEYLRGSDNIDVILDATNTTPSARYQWISDEWECQYKIFKPDVALCCFRAGETDQDDLVSIITRMHEQWDISDIAEEDILK